MRRDTLDRQIEEQAERLLLESIDPNKLRVDREIAWALDVSDVPHALDGFEYLLVEWNTRNPSDHGQHVEHARVMGWTPVRTDDPDGQGLERCQETPEHHIRWGSTILMRLPQTRYIELKARERLRLLQMQGKGTNAEHLVELGEKFGVPVHSELPEDIMRRARQRYQARQQVVNMQFNNPAATQAIDAQLRRGAPARGRS